MASSFLASSSSRQSDSTKAENGFRYGGIEGSRDDEGENGAARTCRKGEPYKAKRVEGSFDNRSKDPEKDGMQWGGRRALENHGKSAAWIVAEEISCGIGRAEGW